MLLQQPDDPFLIYGIALEHAALGDNTQAGTWFGTLFSRFPDYLGGYYAYGAWLLARGRTQEAVSVFETGIDLARRKNDQKTARELRAALDEALDM